MPTLGSRMRLARCSAALGSAAVCTSCARRSATLTCDGRRGSGQRGKTDRGDALVVARIGLRDRERLPRLDSTVLDDELKLLADARDQLIVEAGRWRNRAHALLRVAAPGYQAKTGAL